jgi:uncharacterized RDD family membrane protein YckC
VNPPSAVACGGCGTPLAFADEPVPSALDLELDLDRRSRAAAPAAEAGAPPEAPDDSSQGSEPDPSDWRIGGAAEVPEPEAPEGEPRPASPARRLAAWAIDGALVAALAVALPAALLSFDGLPSASPGALGSGFGAALILCEAFVAVVAFVYATAAHALAGATLGKRIARIRVVGEDGHPPAPAVSAARSAWAVLSLALAGAGLLPALLLPSRRALHDLLAGTRVLEEP